uniref:Uncharacterized protein n=1 Tax=Papio anubis TaxID=9555 RepID=A0A8I5N9P8_PAPAN
MIIVHCTCELLDSSYPLASTSRVPGTTGVCHHAQLIFYIFFVEMGSHCIVQAGLELLASSTPLTWASQSSGIMVVSHNSQPKLTFLKNNSETLHVGSRSATQAGVQ